MSKITRRKFLKYLGISGAVVAVPGVVGADTVKAEVSMTATEVLERRRNHENLLKAKKLIETQEVPLDNRIVAIRQDENGMTWVQSLPTSPYGLPLGTYWDNNGVVNIT